MRSIASALTAVLTLAACGADSVAEAGGQPQVAERYQRNVERAWDLAGEGRSPTMPCALVFGGVVGTIEHGSPDDQARGEALAAADACYVDVTVRYLNHQLDAVEAGETGNCVVLLTGMTLNRNTLGTFIDDIGESRAEYDARIVEAVGERVRAACPNFAGAILGEG